MDDQNNSEEMTPEDRSRKRNQLQRDSVILESDYRKKAGEKDIIESEIRRFKKQAAQAKVEMQVRQENLEKLDQEVFMMEADIKRLKKKMNLIN